MFLLSPNGFCINIMVHMTSTVNVRSVADIFLSRICSHSLLSCFHYFPYCKIFEEHIAPLVLDGGEDDHDADDHAEDDADHQHEAAVHQLQHTGIGIV